ncbi:hypothetical protein YTPLAS72_18420 [Nitrospira sp.]|nr:hypothetical protein YTPLAS72_18420 [Nitrospira sp.]
MHSPWRLDQIETSPFPILRNMRLCLVASLLPMSRGVAVVSLVSFAAILYTCGLKHGKALIVAAILGIILYVIVPDAVWSRMTFSTESREGKMELRTRIYTTALDHLPEYILTGVGAGNYYNNGEPRKGLQNMAVFWLYMVHTTHFFRLQSFGSSRSLNVFVDHLDCLSHGPIAMW